MNKKPHRWHYHPGVRSGGELSLGERAADAMRNGMGSWAFVFGALVFLGLWMAFDGGGLDKFPFILLNLVLSCLAALQGAILLIAAKRSDQIDSELANHHYQETAQHQEILLALKQLLADNTTITRDAFQEGMERVVAALDNLKAADQALRDEVAAFLVDIRGRLSANPNEADLQSIADDINAQVAALKGADPGPATPAPTA